ncbi:MAG: chromophore lyase CpcT/CpeT [Bacteroidota bacterium]
MLKKLLLVELLVLLSILCFGQEESEDFTQLIDWMTGEFSSAEQAQNDSSYYDISLKMTRIWPDKGNGAWLYVEQAVSATPDKPYRQRVYFVREMGDGQFSSDIYNLPEEEKFIGAWENTSVFDGMTQFDLKYKEGCTVFLDYDGFQYSGSTNKGTCKSSLRGANYATSEVMIINGKLESWDRGYDEADNQVWGAEKGAYIFKKVK